MQLPKRPSSTVPLLLVLGLFFSCISLLTACSGIYNGEKLFHQAGCIQCHTFKGKGGRMGPDLSAVTNIRSEDWIIRYLEDPKKMNSFARMPSFAHLSKGKRMAIISYLKQ